VSDKREKESQALSAERDILKQLGAPQDIINKLAGEHILKRWEN